MNNTPKNIHAQELGRLGGRAGRGQSKARPLTTEQARERVAVRWNKMKKEETHMIELFKPSPFDLVGRLVKSRRFIHDTPLAETDCSVARGEIGEVQDYDSLEGLYYVDFGGGAIACYPNEITC